MYARRVEDLALVRLQSEALLRLVPKLPPWEALVIFLYFGLGGDGPLGLRQISRKTRVSHSEVFAAKERGINKLRVWLETRYWG